MFRSSRPQSDFTDAGCFLGIHVRNLSKSVTVNDEVQEYSPGNCREELLQQCRVQRGRQTCVVIDNPLHAANVGCILRQARRFFWMEFNISSINEVKNGLMRNLAMNNKQMICQMNMYMWWLNWPAACHILTLLPTSWLACAYHISIISIL